MTNKVLRVLIQGLWELPSNEARLRVLDAMAEEERKSGDSWAVHEDLTALACLYREQAEAGK
jgi:hypothetical protein